MYFVAFWCTTCDRYLFYYAGNILYVVSHLCLKLTAGKFQGLQFSRIGRCISTLKFLCDLIFYLMMTNIRIDVFWILILIIHLYTILFEKAKQIIIFKIIHLDVSIITLTNISSHTIYCLLFMVKNFHCFVSLPSNLFPKTFTVTSSYKLS